MEMHGGSNVRNLNHLTVPYLFTTNCLVPPFPDATYKDKVYTTGEAGFEGFPHIADRKNGGCKRFQQGN